MLTTMASSNGTILGPWLANRARAAVFLSRGCVSDILRAANLRILMVLIERMVAADPAFTPEERQLFLGGQDSAITAAMRHLRSR